MKYLNITEKELKNKVTEDYFNGFDSTEILGNVDFSIRAKGSYDKSYLWAEAKRRKADINISMEALNSLANRDRTESLWI